jgi:hypothetical protein
MAEPPPVRVITAIQLRAMFNDARYWQRAQSGELQQLIVRDGHPSAPKANEPFCTRSQTIIYREASGQRVAVVHQYLRQDGTLGASGVPDPKKLWQGGVVYEARD